MSGFPDHHCLETGHSVMAAYTKIDTYVRVLWWCIDCPTTGEYRIDAPFFGMVDEKEEAK